MKHPLRSPIETELVRQESIHATGISPRMRHLLDELDADPVRELGLRLIEEAQKLYARAPGMPGYDVRGMAQDIGAITIELLADYRRKAGAG